MAKIKICCSQMNEWLKNKNVFVQYGEFCMTSEIPSDNMIEIMYCPNCGDKMQLED